VAGGIAGERGFDRVSVVTLGKRVCWSAAWNRGEFIGLRRSRPATIGAAR
jgi:hypothetical protein